MLLRGRCSCDDRPRPRRAERDAWEGPARGARRGVGSSKPCWLGDGRVIDTRERSFRAGRFSRRTRAMDGPRIGIVGASGYSGAVAARLVAGHPELSLAFVTSDK